ncbi:DNA primase family protein [Saccharopolyspora kobensis]|nr:DNA primase family protein [Saccharopolyspora kobensis]
MPLPTTYAAAVLGDRPGYLALAFGYRGYVNERGTYTHEEWAETRFAWPAEADQLHAELTHLDASGERVDIYVCPAVRYTDRRRRGDALPPAVCWADLDGDPADPELLAALQPYTVHSGQPGHQHIYVPLSEPVDLGLHTRLNKTLADRLGGDAKWSDESLLRMPGTRNHKTTPPSLVTDAGHWSGRVWEPAELAELLGIPLDAPAAGAGAPVRPVLLEAAPDPLPRRVQAALDHPDTLDRSKAHARLVAACYDSGLSHGQTLSIAANYPPSREKYGDRLADEVARWWSKVDADRGQQPAPITPLAVDGSAALAPAPVVSPETFFDRHTGVRIVALAEAVETYGPVATDEAGKLYRYTGGAWRGDGERIVTARVVELVGDRYRRSHTSNVLDVLRSREPKFTDAGLDTRFLNVPNGLLDWRTGRLHPHDPEVPNLARIPVEWHPEATCPAIDAWLREVFPAEAVPFVHEVIGYALFNGNPLHLAILLYGRGRNGKGTFLRLLGDLIGAANLSAVTPQALDEDRFRAAELHGKLANLVGDVDPKVFKATETFKQITGGDAITAERKYGQPFTFTCRALMVAAFNALPRTADTSEGFFSRWLVLPFTAHFPRGTADSSIEARLHAPAELQGLLAHAVAGLQRVMRRGSFDPPATVEAATREFREVADPVRAFLADSTTADRHTWLPRQSLYSEWQRWAEQHGHHTGSAAAFYERVEAAAVEVYGHPLQPAKRRGMRGFTGARLTRWDE